MKIPRLFVTLGLVCLVAAQASPPGSLGSAGGASPVVAEVDGTKLTAADLERKRPASLVQARNTFYQAQRKVVDDFVDEYLLERQAEKEKVTVAQLIDKHVKSALPKDPSEEALRVFYEGAQNATQPFDAVRGQILEQIRNARIEKGKAAYTQSLRAAAKIAIRLEAPRVNIALKGSPIRGSANAPVMIVEYADYECPYCQQIQPTLEKIEKDFAGKVAFAYKDVPLPMHKSAQKASEAAHCAGAQGKYWEYHDLLYSSAKLELPQLKEHAGNLKLDTAAFNTCLDSGAQAGVVKDQLVEAQALQLQGTPTFFINGRLFSGNLAYDQFRAVIDEELNGSPSQTAQR